MAGCKRCALKRKKGKGNKKRKEKEKGGKKWGSKSFFYISPCACFFICAVVIFKYIRKTVS